MPTDPASVTLTVEITGLANDEAMCALSNTPAGAAATAVVAKPAIGPKRYAISVTDLSLLGAKDLTTAMFLYFERRNQPTATEDTDHA